MALPLTLIIALVREVFAGPAMRIIDSYVTNAELREKLKGELQHAMIAEAERRLAVQRDIVVKEIEAGSWLAKSWRPLFMILLMSFVAVYGLALPLADLIAGTPLAFRPRWNELPAEFWEMLTIGLGGYVGGRSLEKIATTIAGKGKAAK
jgi:hypothetical protein